MSLKTASRMLIAATLLTLAGCIPAAGSEIPSAPSGLIVITNGTVITATGSEPIPDGTVVLEGDRIVYAGEAAGFSIPEGARVLDARGGTILPGFIDAHTHGTADPAVRRSFLLDGVTSICDLGAPLDDMEQFDLAFYRDDPVARGFHAGPIITAPGGLPDVVLGEDLNYEVATPEEGRAAVQYLHQQGVDQIKVYLHTEANGISYPMLDAATLDAIVEEAHSLDLPVRAHVTYASLLEMAVAAGVDTVEHVPVNQTRAEQEAADPEFMLQLLESSDPVELLFTEGSPEYAALIGEMAEAGIILVPTLERPYGRFIATQEPVDRMALDIVLGIVGAFNQMGGEVGLGTDFNLGTGMVAGMPIGKMESEMEMLLAAGLTPLEVIEAGTRIAAASCGQGGSLGTLEPGKLADVIVVAGDPLEDLSAMEDVVLVILGGEVVYTAETMASGE